MRRFSLALVSLLLVSTGCALLGASAPTPSGDFAGLDDVIAHERRGDDGARDAHRHPAATLRFFDVQPTHTVAEYAPGQGWYTKILAPYVSERGRYVAVSFRGEDTGIARLEELLAGWTENFPNLVEKTTGVPAGYVSAYHASDIPEEAHGTVDRIVIPRMVHNLLRWNIAGRELRGLRTLLKETKVGKRRERPVKTRIPTMMGVRSGKASSSW